MKFLQKLFIVASFLFIQTTYAQVFTPAQVREDMTLLKHKLEKYHPELYAYISKDSYDKLYDSLYRSVTQPMMYQQAFLQIAPLVMAVQDGHTAMGHQEKYFSKKSKLVPLYIRKLQISEAQTNFFISYNCSKDTSLVRGTEIYFIDGMPIQEIFTKMSTIVSADYHNELSRMYYLQGDFPSFFLKYFGQRDSVSITYRLPKESTIRQKKIVCLDGREVGKALTTRYKWAIRQNLTLKVVDSVNKVATLDITTFLHSGSFLDFGNHKFKRLLRNDFQKIKDKGIQHLIIDLRGNGGGYIPNVSRLLKYLLPAPFTLVDTLEFKKKAYFKVAPITSILPPLVLWTLFPKRREDLMYRVNQYATNQKPETDLHFDGKVYFLINSGCYSATVFTVAIAKDNGIGTYIGEQVGGASWGSHAVTWYDFNLPNTKIRIHSPLFRLTHKLKTSPKTFFLQPDFTVGRNYEELLKNNDNILNFTLGMIRASYFVN